MEQVGWKLVYKDGEVLESWGGAWGSTQSVPNPVILPSGLRIHGMEPELDYEGYKLVPWMMEKPAANSDDVIREREKRLAEGFEHDFGDERGIHHIGTTPQDMAGWSEVTQFAQAAAASGLGTTPINIVTNTGPVQLTAMEWLGVLLHAAVVRQPIWANSFIIQEMKPIPEDYGDDKYWGG